MRGLLGSRTEVRRRNRGFRIAPESERTSWEVRLVPLTEVGFSFDQFVGELLEKQRHLKAQRLGGLEIDDKTKPRRSLHG